MQRFLGTIDFGSMFAYPKPAQPPPPSLAEKYANEARDKAQREHREREEHARLLAMSPEERKTWVAEQRKKFAETEALLGMTQPERREYIERVRRETQPLQYRETVTEHADGEQQLLFTEPVTTERETRNGDGRFERRDYAVDDDGAADIDIIERKRAEWEAERRTAWEAADPETRAVWDSWETWVTKHIYFKQATLIDNLAVGIHRICGKLRREHAAEVAGLRNEVAELRGQVEMLTRMLSGGGEHKTLRLPNWRRRDAA